MKPKYIYEKKKSDTEHIVASAKQLETPFSWEVRACAGFGDVAFLSSHVGGWERILETGVCSGLVLSSLHLQEILPFICPSDFPYIK